MGYQGVKSGMHNDEGDTRTVTIKTEVLDDTLETIQTIADRQGWSCEEALRNLVHHGITAVQALEEMDPEPEDADPEDHLLQLNRELAGLRAAYSSLKFENYTLTKDNQVLQWHVAGQRGTTRNQEKLIERLREELELRRERDPDR